MLILGNIIFFFAYLFFILLFVSILYILGVTVGLVDPRRFKGLFTKLKFKGLREKLKFSSAMIPNANLKLLLNMTLLVVATRLVIALIAYMGWIYVNGQVPVSLFAVEKMMWGEQWDASHYLFIAQYGYMPSDPQQASLILFPPLFPQLIKILWFVVRDYF